ncbi:hypothetical protein SNEBB_010960 [Seison nebaliae]|nr:hypothetical protein SNEBB_010960 [Seison nebaliae]
MFPFNCRSSVEKEKPHHNGRINNNTSYLCGDSCKFDSSLINRHIHSRTTHKWKSSFLSSSSSSHHRHNNDNGNHGILLEKPAD